jgi:cytochrome c oxidase subunit 4
MDAAIERSTWSLVVVWALLLALTFLSWALSFAHLGDFELVGSLLIAALKSALVLSYFMHLGQERFSTKIVPIGAVLLTTLLVGLMALDVGTRRTFPRAPSGPAPIVLPARSGSGAASPAPVLRH